MIWDSHHCFLSLEFMPCLLLIMLCCEYWCSCSNIVFGMNIRLVCITHFNSLIQSCAFYMFWWASVALCQNTIKRNLFLPWCDAYSSLTSYTAALDLMFRVESINFSKFSHDLLDFAVNADLPSLCFFFISSFFCLL